MGVNCAHPDYVAAAAEWSRARDVLAGEDAVKAAGDKYLPKLESQTEAEYAAYKARASFFGGTAHTVEEYLDLIFRRAPALAHGSGDQLKAFVADCDLWGLDFVRYARRVVSEVLSVGRGGSLVLCGDDGVRPHVSFWRAEDIMNWSVERVQGRVVLSSVVLRVSDVELMVLKVGDSGCVLERWSQAGEDWIPGEQRVLKRDGAPVSFIPFVFHGPRHSRPDRDKLPLADIIFANLDHYRLDADYKHGLHFTALPTAWVAGFANGADLKVGSRAAWVSDIPGATAGFLEFTGAGLGHLERAIEKVERRMSLLGARMLEAPQSELSTINSQPSTSLSGLGAIVASLNDSLSRVLQLAQWWVEGGQAVPAPNAAGAAGDGGVTGVGFAMNTDLGARAMSGDEITAVVAAWRAGAISRDTMLERLKRGEVLPDGRSVAQERALIHGKAVAA